MEHRAQVPYFACIFTLTNLTQIIVSVKGNPDLIRWLWIATNLIGQVQSGWIRTAVLFPPFGSIYWRCVDAKRFSLVSPDELIIVYCVAFLEQEIEKLNFALMKISLLQMVRCHISPFICIQGSRCSRYRKREERNCFTLRCFSYPCAKLLYGI